MNREKMIEEITEEIVRRLGAEKASTGAPVASGAASASLSASSDNVRSASTGTAPILPSEIAPYIDHTLLKPEATAEQHDVLCEEAVTHKFYSVCVNSSWVAHCAKKLQGTPVRVCAVVGFPLGAMSGRAKNFETRHAIEDGAREIDMVINVGALKSGHLKQVEDDIRWVRRACARNVVLKVIIETALLTDEEKVIACRIAQKAGADFVKTSTGFSHHGATVRDVQLMRRTVGPKLGVKAAGGVRSIEDAIQMIEAGATRLGTSSGIKIIQGETVDGGY
jgi:deoxyribose-phosphate aldolase